MMVLDYGSVMLNMINDYASLSTEKRWLISAFGGMIMCKLVSIFLLSLFDYELIFKWNTDCRMLCWTC